MHLDVDHVPCPVGVWAYKKTEYRNTVITHEHFHVIGLHDGPKPTTTAQALRSPDYLTLGKTSRTSCDYPCPEWLVKGGAALRKKF